MEIWEESQHLYGAPKITAKLRKMGIQISERTVGKYMKELKIRAKYCKPFTVTTRDSNLNNKLKNILDEQFMIRFGALIQLIFQLKKDLYI